MVDFDIRLSIARQCRLLSISRSRYYYETKGESLFNQKLMRMIDEQFLKTPNYGSRKMSRWLDVSIAWGASGCVDSCALWDWLLSNRSHGRHCRTRNTRCTRTS